MNRLARALFSIAVLLVSTVAAGADEEPPVIRALLDSAAATATARPTYGSIEVAADGTITLSGLKATYHPDRDPDQTMTYEVESLVLAGVTEIGTGVFEVGNAEWSHTTMSFGEDAVAAIPLISARALYIHQPVEAPTAIERLRASQVLAREFTIPEAMVLVSGHGIVMEGLRGVWDGDPMTGDGTSRFSARRIHVPGDVFEAGENPLAMAGYSELVLAIDGTSTMDYSDDAVAVEVSMRIDGADVGSLTVEFGADGIPLALFTVMDATDPDPDAALSLAEGMSLKRVRVRFEDNSLTGRLLALMADAEGTDVATFVADGSAGIELALSEVLDPKLAAEVSAALGTYLNDPRTITFALAPLQPVRLDQVMTGLADPVALIELLQPSVTAND